MAIVNFSTTYEHSARLEYDNLNYYTAHSNAMGTVTNAYALLIRQYYKAGEGYYIARGAVSFDCSTIPADALIINAYLKCYAYGNAIPITVLIKNGQPTYPSLEPVAADYNIANYSGNGGEGVIPDAGGTIVGFNIDFNSLGISWINRSGYTKLLIVSEKDEDEEPPIDISYVSYIYAWNPPASQYNMVLTVEYFLPTETPTVTTINEACEDRQATTLTAVGNITGSGDGYTFRGFEYHQYDSEYDSSMWAVREIGRFVAPGEYRMTLYGLKPSTVYWICAFAGNVFGISYGEWILCSTTGVQVGTYDVYTEPNTAKYRLYVSDDEAIAWRGYKGPYSGKQTNINIKDITNLTKGMKVLKIDLPEAGKKGTFHICISVKQTLKS